MNNVPKSNATASPLTNSEPSSYTKLSNVHNVGTIHSICRFLQVAVCHLGWAMVDKNEDQLGGTGNC